MEKKLCIRNGKQVPSIVNGAILQRWVFSRLSTKNMSALCWENNLKVFISRKTKEGKQEGGVGEGGPVVREMGRARKETERL